jgi:hypothetical protein
MRYNDHKWSLMATLSPKTVTNVHGTLKFPLKKTKDQL